MVLPVPMIFPNYQPQKNQLWVQISCAFHWFWPWKRLLDCWAWTWWQQSLRHLLEEQPWYFPPLLNNLIPISFLFFHYVILNSPICTIPIFLLFHLLLSFYYFFPPLPICTMPIFSPSVLSQNNFLFYFFTCLLLYSLTFLLLSFYSLFYSISFLYIVDLVECKDGPYNMYFPLLLLLSFSGLSAFLFKFITFFWRLLASFILASTMSFSSSLSLSVNNLWYNRPHNFIIYGFCHLL